jgi:hypothetical protein
MWRASIAVIVVSGESHAPPMVATFNAGEFGKCNVARPKRFELLTPRFVVWCSIQLSYGRGAT